jgi:hypothetical protein
MNKNYLQNIRNIKQSQPQPVEQTPQYQPTPEGDAGSGWPKQSVYDINFEEFFRASSESTNEAIRQTMSQLRALDQAEAAAAAEAVFGPGESGYGVVEESQPATETFADQF